MYHDLAFSPALRTAGLMVTNPSMGDNSVVGIVIVVMVVVAAVGAAALFLTRKKK